MKTIIRLIIGMTVVTSCIAEPVITVDKENIITLSKEAITNKFPNIQIDSLEFMDLTYQINPTKNESLKINFRQTAVKPETKTKSDGDSTAKTTKASIITVSMDNDGKIISISEGVSSSVTISSTMSSSEFQKRKEAFEAKKKQREAGQ